MGGNVKPVGPTGQPEPDRTKKDRAPNPEAFKQAYSKVEKVEETHPDQAKKRRMRKEEDDTPEEAAPPPPPRTPFSLEAEKSKDSIVYGASTKQTFSAPPQPGPAEAPPTTPPDTDIWEEEPQTEEESPTPPTPPQPQSYQPPQTPPTVGPPQSPPPPQEQPIGTPVIGQPQPGVPTQQQQQNKATPLPPPPLVTPPKGKRPAAPKVEPKALRKESTTSTAKRGETHPAKGKVEEKVEEPGETFSTTPPRTLETPPHTKKEQEKEEMAPLSGATPVVSPLVGEPLMSSGPAPYIYLHPKVYEYFERMVSSITVMRATGLTETTITLNEKPSSLFAGAQIVLREFGTATGQFNIEFIANPEAVALFTANVDDLMAAFRTGGYNFKINRIDTRIEKPQVRRKESGEK